MLSMKRIVVMAYRDSAWRNEDLGKDCGLVPYIMARKAGAELTLVTGPGEEYTYDKLMPELTIHMLEDNSVEAKSQYLQDHGREIDLLMLYGITYHNIVSASIIRQINPDCKITCALDLNDEYIDRIPFWEQPFFDYFNGMDLMWQSDTLLTEFVNNKWDWDIVCARNGYYNLPMKTSDIEYYPFEKRENTIVYIGRINNGPKGLKVLLEAFAAAADSIPGWNLKMVGTIEHPFEELIEAYFDYYPELQDRVTFTGRIDDKAVLHHEYEKAKIFAASSVVEGGTPNAFAEALCTGCVMAITRINAYNDILGDNETGKSVPIGDTKAFTDMLIELCNADDLEKKSLAAYERGKELYSLERAVDMLYGKLCDKGF